MCQILNWKLAYPNSAPWFVWWDFAYTWSVTSFFYAELLLFVFMSYWCSYSWINASVCIILYCILFHVTISNFRVIVDSILDHKWWCLTWACYLLQYCNHHHQCCQTNPFTCMGDLHSFWSNSCFVPRPDSFFCCDWNTFRGSWLSVGADFFLLFLIAAYNLLYFLIPGSDQPQHPPLLWEPWQELLRAQWLFFCSRPGKNNWTFFTTRFILLSGFAQRYSLEPKKTDAKRKQSTCIVHTSS